MTSWKHSSNIASDGAKHNLHQTWSLPNRTTYSLKINKLIKSSQEEFFLTQLLRKMPVLELKNRLAFHRTWTADIQSILELLQLIHNFLACDNAFTLFFYVFPVASVRAVSSYPLASSLCFILFADDRRVGSIRAQVWSLWTLMSSIQINYMVNKFKLLHRLVYFW